METKTLQVQGMMCEACVGHVTKALSGLDGVQSASVSLENAQATVTYDPVKVGVPRMQESIEEEGYQASL